MKEGEFFSPNNPLNSPLFKNYSFFKLKYVRTSINYCPAPQRKTEYWLWLLIQQKTEDWVNFFSYFVLLKAVHIGQQSCHASTASYPPGNRCFKPQPRHYYETVFQMTHAILSSGSVYISFLMLTDLSKHVAKWRNCTTLLCNCIQTPHMQNILT